ncbi:hypothetical protein EDM56_04510 [Brevibacillus fluminis]|uniref:Uncharacterized protein n=1 Tax=Brevibacillus fluminis TaxID=511487 RepID=A0A3M8DV19_9BACL|nr:hypothetical protein [Brevibacillus fluminis]RNB92018.1 hypothetical protein EDM56_04510 [Brevibacillus fluminis]
MLDGKDGVSPQDGEAETIRLKFSANLDPLTVQSDSFTVEGFTVESIRATDKGGRIPGETLYRDGERNYITIKVIPRPGTDFEPRVTQKSGATIKDINNVSYDGIRVQATDLAAPVITNAEFIDNGTVGVVDIGDKIKITLSEQVSGNVADLYNDFTLDNSSEAFSFTNNDEFSIDHNVVTVTIQDPTTIAKIWANTSIIITSNASYVSLTDASGNKAKPGKQLDSTPLTIEIEDVPEVN